MVTGRVGGPTTDRGQLVLIGAISIAFILLGLVVVFNGIQYTQTIDSGSASADTSDVEMTEHEIRTVIERKHGGSVSNIDDLDWVTDDFEERYAMSRERERPVTITIENVDINGEGYVYVEYTYSSTDVSVSGTAETNVQVNP